MIYRVTLKLLVGLLVGFALLTVMPHDLSAKKKITAVEFPITLRPPSAKSGVTTTVDLMPQIHMEVEESYGRQRPLEDVEKRAYLYEEGEDKIPNWLSATKEVEKLPVNAYSITTSKGKATIDTEGVLTYTPNLDATGFDEFYYNLEFTGSAGKEVKSLTIRIDIVAQDKPLIISTYPNPFTNETVLMYHLEQPSEVSIELFDVRGKLLSVVQKPILQVGGTYSISLDGQQLPKGMNYAIIKTSYQRTITKLICLN